MPKTLEGKIVRVSDVIAYVNHDIDDAIRAGVIKGRDIPQNLTDILGRWHASRIDRMVASVVKTSLKSGLEQISLGEEVEEAVNALREFLFEKVYFNSKAKKELEKTEKILTDIYSYVRKKPEEFIKSYPIGDSFDKRCGDFMAGMTDLFALRLYERFFFPKTWPVL